MSSEGPGQIVVIRVETKSKGPVDLFTYTGFANIPKELQEQIISLGQERLKLEGFGSWFENRPNDVFTVVYDKDGQVVGFCGGGYRVYSIDEEEHLHGEPEGSIVGKDNIESIYMHSSFVVPDFEQQGVGTEAAKATIEQLLEGRKPHLDFYTELGVARHMFESALTALKNDGKIKHWTLVRSYEKRLGDTFEQKEKFFAYLYRIEYN